MFKCLGCGQKIKDRIHQKSLEEELEQKLTNHIMHPKNYSLAYSLGAIAQLYLCTNCMALYAQNNPTILAMLERAYTSFLAKINARRAALKLEQENRAEERRRQNAEHLKRVEAYQRTQSGQPAPIAASPASSRHSHHQPHASPQSSLPRAVPQMHRRPQVPITSTNVMDGLPINSFVPGRSVQPPSRVAPHASALQQNISGTLVSTSVASTTNPSSCPICIEEFRAHERTKRLPCCKQYIHQTCAEEIVQSQGSIFRCPLCLREGIHF